MKIRHLAAALPIVAASILPAGLADAASCWARGMNGAYENRPVVYGDCTSGSAQMNAYFLTQTGVPYRRAITIEAGGGVEYVYGRPGERVWSATLS